MPVKQDICLLREDGWEFMEYYDRLPPNIRFKLQHTAQNFCAACVYDALKLRLFDPDYLTEGHKMILAELGLIKRSG